MRPEQTIANFLRPPSEGGAYSDEKLDALLAHAEDGKLSFTSCCCLIGIPTTGHALQGRNYAAAEPHYVEASLRPGWLDVENAFARFFDDVAITPDLRDALRRAKLIPLIRSEMARRETLRAQVEVSEIVTV